VPYIVNELRQSAAQDAVPVSYAEIDAGKCAFCYSCYRVCPHAALEPDASVGAMACIENACMACGICAAICPGEAIVLTGEHSEPSPSYLPDSCMVFCCENSAEPAFAEIGRELGKNADKLCLSKIPCGGRLGGEAISGALASYGKVLVAVCIDEACRHMNGGKRACKQVERIVLKLQKSGMDEKRLKFVQVSHAMPKVLMENVKAFLDDK